MSPREPVFVKNVNPAILKLEPYVPGPTTDEIAGLAQISPKDVIKLSSNENPLGPSPKVVETVRQSALKISLYPSAKCERLRKAVARIMGHDLTADNIVISAGSSEIFSFIIRAFSRPEEEVIHCDPSFSVYRDAAIVDSRVPVPITLSEPSFELKISDIECRYSEKTKVIFVTRPNNPTSRLVPLTEVRRICELAENAVVVCDEAYIEFADDYERVSAVNLLGEFDNLLVSRTFSKAYGLSDLRIGYAIGPSEAISVLFKIRPKWNNGELAQEAAMAALNDTDHLSKTLATVHEGRIFLIEKLKTIGFIVTPNPQGNFVFASPASLGLSAERILADLMKHGIAVRGPPTDWKINYLRISVGTADQNARLISVLKEILKS